MLASTLPALIFPECFEALDKPVRVVGSVDVPAIPLNSALEATMIPSKERVGEAIGGLLGY